jgi:hypothetical protein
MRFYQPKFFTTQELVPKAVYDRYGDSAMHLCMDSRILWTIDQLATSPLFPRLDGRDHTVIRVNTWPYGGDTDQRGYRTDPEVGAELSQHRFGRAVDLTIEGISAEEVRQLAKKGKLDRELTYITCIEDDVSWLHLDCRSISGNRLVFFHS